MSYGEGVVRKIAATLLDEEVRNWSPLEGFGNHRKICRFRLSKNAYDEAVDTLQGMGVEIEGARPRLLQRKVLTQDFDVPHFPHYPKIAKPFYHRVDPDDEKYVLCPIYWHPKAMEKSSAVGKELGLKRKYLPELTKKEHHENRINFTLTRAHMGVFHTAVSA